MSNPECSSVSCFSVTMVIAISQVIVSGWNKSITAQIIPDDTLGEERSVVTPDNINGIESERISGGAVRGNNLFHSFREFNIGEGKGGYFENPAVIENIFSRVTGSNPSEILGTLGVLGNANLFFLNPNGIIFGENASLDVRGSFLGTTADSIVFPDGKQFSATNPGVPPLLTVNVQQPIGLQFEGESGIITNQGILAVGESLTLSAVNLDLQGQLQAGNDLTLQATNTVKIRDSVAQSFIVAAGNQLVVQGNQKVDIFALNHPESVLFSGGDMVLRSSNTVGGDTHYWSGGNFLVETLDEAKGNFSSSQNIIINTHGDVNFATYTGNSLHIFAGGSVDIDSITINNNDEINSLKETVTLSNGNTLEIDSSRRATLDIRAGIIPTKEPLGIIDSLTGTNSSPVKVKLIKPESHAQVSLMDNENKKVGCTIV